MARLRIGVVGTGAAGLSAVKNALNFGCDVLAFEKNDEIGGTWIYTDDVGTDKNGTELFSGMYQGLLTNTPKELMNFPDFPFPPIEKSFLTSTEVLDYFKIYAEKFNLRRFIKLEHHVQLVRPLSDSTWEISVKNLRENKLETHIFDAVFVCSGLTSPSIPKIPGQQLFKGKQEHSQNYRKPQAYENERVLVIGGGPSGIDIAFEVGKYATHVGWSNHLKAIGLDLGISLPKAVRQMPDVVQLSETGAWFSDGNFEEYSVIFYATGYAYNFPFLSVDSGLSSHDKFIYPLYKHCLNINRPTLAIISLTGFSLAMPLFDLQVRFCLTFWTKRKQLPPRDEMLQDTDNEMNEKWKTMAKCKSHFVGLERNASYCEDIAKTAGIVPLKPAVVKMFEQNFSKFFENFNEFRNFHYKIIDDENFVVT